MATVIFDNFRNAQMGNPGGTTTTIDFNADDVRFVLLEGSAGDGVVHAVTHSSLDDVDGTAGAAILTNGNMAAGLTSPTVGSVSVGTFDAADFSFTSVSGANDADYLTLYKYNATASNATLVLSYDSATTGLPLTPNGGDVNVTLNPSGIVRI